MIIVTVISTMNRNEPLTNYADFFYTLEYCYANSVRCMCCGNSKPENSTEYCKYWYEYDGMITIEPICTECDNEEMFVILGRYDIPQQYFGPLEMCEIGSYKTNIESE